MEAIARILIIGGPGSGKSSVIYAIEQRGHVVHHEISRHVIKQAQEQGIDQLFLTDPLAFSNQLLAGRINQFNAAKTGVHFYDRGIPDVPAYHLFSGDTIPQEYLDASKVHRYDYIFYLPPWQDIYESDAERYETYEQALEIGHILFSFYKRLHYEPVTVPLTAVEERVDFILNRIARV